MNTKKKMDFLFSNWYTSDNTKKTSELLSVVDIDSIHTKILEQFLIQQMNKYQNASISACAVC